MFCLFRLLLDDLMSSEIEKIISRQVLAFSGMLRTGNMYNEMFEDNLSGKCIRGIKLTHDDENRKAKNEMGRNMDAFAAAFIMPVRPRPILKAAARSLCCF